MSERTTDAGRRLDSAWPGSHLDRAAWHDAILAIEQEAREIGAAEGRREYKAEVGKLKTMLREVAAARADLAAAIIAAVEGLDGFSLTVDNEYQTVEGDWDRKEYIVPPHRVVVTVGKDVAGMVDRVAVLRAIREASDDRRA